MPGDAPLLHVTSDERGPDEFAADLVCALTALGRPCELVTVESAGPGPVRQLAREAKGRRLVVAHGSTAYRATTLACPDRTTVVYRIGGELPSRPRLALPGRSTLSRAARVVCPWPGAAAELRAGGVSHKKLVVIADGVRVRDHRPVTAEERASARAALSLDERTPVVAYAGADRPADVQTAADAVAAANELRSTVVPGPMQLLVGHDPAIAIAAADIVIVPGEPVDGVPRAAVIAALRARPVVTTDVGGAHTAVRDGHSGVLVPHGSRPGVYARALHQAWEHRDTFGTAGRAHCAVTFDLTVAARGWAAVLPA